MLWSPQVVLINAVKDVAKALGNLISATKAAAGKPHDDPSMLQLKNSAKVRRSIHHIRPEGFVLKYFTLDVFNT